MKKSKRKLTKSDKVRQLLAKGLSVKEIVKRVKVTAPLVYAIRSKDKPINFYKPEPKIGEAEIAATLVKDPNMTLEQAVALLNPDMVSHPPHYTAGKIEVIDFIEDQKLSYHLGNVIKYVCRANHKGSELEDLKKAQWYLNRAIERYNQ